MCMTQNEDWNGISIKGTEKLMLDIIDYADRCNKISNQITDLVNESSEYFNCESATMFREYYNQVANEITTLNKNILSYNTDLLNVKKNYEKRNLDSSNLMSEFTRKTSIHNEIREVK